MEIIPTLLTVKQFSEKHPAFSEGSLRWLIFNEETNGLKNSGATLNIGRKRLIHEANFFHFICSQNSTKLVSKYDK